MEIWFLLVEVCNALCTKHPILSYMKVFKEMAIFALQ